MFRIALLHALPFRPYHLLGPVLLLLPLLVSAQTDEASEASKEGALQRARAAYNQGELEDALHSFSSVIRQDSSHWEGWFMRGVCLYGLERYPEARAPLERAWQLDSAGSVNLYFYLAEARFYDLAYEQAIPLYKRFLDHKRAPFNLTEQARMNLRKALYAADALADSIDFRPENLGPRVNTEGDEYNAFLTANEQKLFFNAHREGCLGGRDERVYKKYASDFFVSTKGPDGAWQTAAHPGPPLNSNQHEKEFWLAPDGRTLVFGRHPRTPTASQYDCDIYRSTWTGSAWTEPNVLEGGPNSRHCDSWPSLTADGKTLYFVSNRPGGSGGFDVWVSQRLPGGRWSKAQNAGPTINTPGDEFDVFIHPDEQTLYFTSDWHDGFGGFDIFLSRRQAGGHWGTPENLGYPLNTPYDEFDFYVNAAGTRGYINSNRFGGYGQQDLYRFPLDVRIRPVGTATVTGKVLAAATQEPLSAEVSVLHLPAGDTLVQTRSDVEGRFVVALPLRERYAVHAEREGYLFGSRHFALSDSSQRQREITVELEKVATGSHMDLNNVFFDLDEARLKPESKLELQKLADFLQANKHIRIELIGHTDSQGTESHNQSLSKRRARAVREFLVQQGIASERMRTQGRGEAEPVAPNDTPQGRARNRRTEVEILSAATGD